MLNRLNTPSAQRRMLGMRSDIWKMLPAAGAFVMSADFDGGGEVGAAGAGTDWIHAAIRTSAR